jgi:hypothetical protein
MIRTLLAATMIAFSMQPANALSGLELMKYCSHKAGIEDTSCLSYMRGFTDGFFSGTALGKTNIKTCLPSQGVEAEQTRLIVEAYLREHPEQLHREAGLLAMSAMIKAFPCP